MEFKFKEVEGEDHGTYISFRYGCEYWVYLEILNPGFEDLIVAVFLSFDANKFDYTFGPDWEPTYVPYGSTMVMSDRGGSELEAVDVKDEIKALYPPNFWDKEDFYKGSVDDIPTDRIQIKYHLNDAEFANLCEQAKSFAIARAKEAIPEIILNDSDYWPEPSDDWPDPSDDYEY